MIELIINLYTNKIFNITTLLTNNHFSKMSNQIYEIFDRTFDKPASFKQVGVIKQMIHVKLRAKSIILAGKKVQ